MFFRNTEDRYGIIARGFHLVVALLVLTMIGIGLYMTSVKMPMGAKFQLFGFHKELGVTILALMVLRLVWRLSNIRPTPLPSHRAWEKTLARFTHFLLYAALFIMPLSGWLGSSAKGSTVSYFGLFPLPNLVGENHALAHILWTIHGFTAYTLIALIVLHIAGALKHAFIDHDGTLARMIPFLKAR